jgi:Zn-dependent protease
MKDIFLGLVSGLSASLVCFWLSSRMLKAVGDRALVIHIPVIEETGKTVIALLLNGNVVISHLAFGAAEALYDLYNSPKKYCITAALLSLVSHSLIGYLTCIALRVLCHPVLVIIIASIIHSLWNRIMTGYTG